MTVTSLLSVRRFCFLGLLASLMKLTVLTGEFGQVFMGLQRHLFSNS